MGAKTKRRKAPSPIEQLDGPTEAQLANGHYCDELKPHPDGGNRVAQVKVNRGGELNGRLFKVRHFDRLQRAGQFSQEQYLAGMWYRDQYERGRYDSPTMSNLFRTGGSSSVVAMGASETSQVARDRWRAARMALPADMVGFMDALLLRNRWPKMHHRERFRTLDRLRDALDTLCSHLGTKRG